MSDHEKTALRNQTRRVYQAIDEKCRAERDPDIRRRLTTLATAVSMRELALISDGPSKVRWQGEKRSRMFMLRLTPRYYARSRRR
jgi:hypothetical protein